MSPPGMPDAARSSAGTEDREQGPRGASIGSEHTVRGTRMEASAAGARLGVRRG